MQTSVYLYLLYPLQLPSTHGIHYKAYNNFRVIHWCAEWRQGMAAVQGTRHKAPQWVTYIYRQKHYSHSSWAPQHFPR